LSITAVACADITTSFWQPDNGNSARKLGFYGSVINAENGQLTVAIEYDNSTDMEGLELDPNDRNYGTYTLASTLWDWSTSLAASDIGASEDITITSRCSMPGTGSDASYTCTSTLLDEWARAKWCAPIPTGSDDVFVYMTRTYSHSYSSGTWGPAGVETVTEIATPASITRTKTADWCSESGVPSSALVEEEKFPRESVVTYQLVITEGEEKLEAETGAGVGTGSLASSTGSVASSTGSVASSTGSVASSTGSATSATESAESSTETATGIAAPMKTFAPALVGVGALAAAILL
jgi:hypothetical protein